MGLKRDIFEYGIAAARHAYTFRTVERPRSIFVLRNNDLGDLTVITPLFCALRSAFPEARIVAGVGKWSKEILKYNPHISEIIECNAPWHNKFTGDQSLRKSINYIFRSDEVRALKAQHFDVGIDVLGSQLGSLLLIHMGIPVRLGRKGYAGGHRAATAYLNASKEESVAKGSARFVNLISPSADIDIDLRPQLFLSDLENRIAEEMWGQISKSPNQRFPRIVIAPGAGFADKQWPAHLFGALVKRLSQWSCGYVIGSSHERAVADQIIATAERWKNKCGEVSLRESMALISTADLVISNSSLTMHLAAGFSKPCIVLLNRVHDPTSHRILWEIEGLHHQMFPKDGDQYVSIDDVESQVRMLLKIPAV
ncbi:MAG TPA: glycosyltransferase family 9 protein [Edaphobacter sp.]|nr:glycosyltransferase family 9 protein [Edaphobacter sp.]